MRKEGEEAKNLGSFGRQQERQYAVSVFDERYVSITINRCFN